MTRPDPQEALRAAQAAVLQLKGEELPVEWRKKMQKAGFRDINPNDRETITDFDRVTRKIIALTDKLERFSKSQGVVCDPEEDEYLIRDSTVLLSLLNDMLSRTSKGGPFSRSDRMIFRAPHTTRKGSAIGNIIHDNLYAGADAMERILKNENADEWLKTHEAELSKNTELTQRIGRGIIRKNWQDLEAMGLDSGKIMEQKLADTQSVSDDPAVNRDLGEQLVQKTTAILAKLTVEDIRNSPAMLRAAGDLWEEYYGPKVQPVLDSVMKKNRRAGRGEN